MKLSDLTTDRALDVLCEITPFVSNITGDKALMDTLKSQLEGEKHSAAEVYAHLANKLSSSVLLILKDHREDVFGLLAVLQETTPEAIASQNIVVTLSQIRDVVHDKEFVAFFGSWQQADGTK